MATRAVWNPAQNCLYSKEIFYFNKAGRMECESALQWFTRVNDPRTCLNSGHAALDEILGNTFPPKSVTEIYGERGVGRVELLMTVVARMLTCPEKMEWMAVVLDYSGSFRTDQLLKLIRRLSTHDDDEFGMELLKKVVFQRVYKEEDLKSSLARLATQFASSPLIPLVIVNGVGAILSDTSFMEQEEGTLEQNQILRLMREFCAASGGTILTSNHAVSWRGFPTPALGHMWINGISTRILLHHDEETNLLSAVVQSRSAGKVINCSVFYKIDDGLFTEPIIEPMTQNVLQLEASKAEVEMFRV